MNNQALNNRENNDNIGNVTEGVVKLSVEMSTEDYGVLVGGYNRNYLYINEELNFNIFGLGNNPNY
ncbi:hypothetical protein FPZ43_09560 [Mucilaginibacter pallidiroseus]|uniref:Uncharacterized protein n=1 Tax=Mucilaginibacter pallidiroseus TaxID=2599295 RepID=A0A563UCW1_9SPHI|nr:hypothetical protein [Mucilaginibacter pallidiroseus]TWR29211.1 hypothetical protein FPZ43_09560 [Mucilaginibacter pallidiroseus]